MTLTIVDILAINLLRRNKHTNEHISKVLSIDLTLLNIHEKLKPDINEYFDVTDNILTWRNNE